MSVSILQTDQERSGNGRWHPSAPHPLYPTPCIRITYPPIARRLICVAMPSGQKAVCCCQQNADLGHCCSAFQEFPSGFFKSMKYHEILPKGAGRSLSNQWTKWSQLLCFCGWCIAWEHADKTSAECLKICGFAKGDHCCQSPSYSSPWIRKLFRWASILMTPIAQDHLLVCNQNFRQVRHIAFVCCSYIATAAYGRKKTDGPQDNPTGKALIQRV